MKVNFKNITTVELGGKLPGEVFPLDVMDDGKTPSDLYWRKRIADGSVEPDVEPAAAPPAKASKKGAK